MNITLSQAIEGFLLEKAVSGCSPHTIRNYTLTLRRLSDHFDADPPLRAITADQIRAFLHQLQTTQIAPAGPIPRPPRQLSPKTILNIHTCLSSLWTWATQEGYTDHHIIRDITPPDPDPPIIEPFTRDEIQDLLKAADYSAPWKNRPHTRSARPPEIALRDKAIIYFLLDTGIRAAELCNLRLSRPELSERERQRREEHNQRIFQDIVEAGWDVVVSDEAHKLSKHADGTETARYRVGEALAQAVPVFLLFTATPHQGDAARFLHLLNLVDPYAFNQVSDLRPDRVSTVVWRTRKRAAVDGQGRRLFKQRLTDIYPVDRSGPEHALERELYDAVTDYVRENYNLALGRGDQAFSFLMILFQRLVTSSTQAIYEALAKRLEKLVALQAHLPESSKKAVGHTSVSKLSGR